MKRLLIAALIAATCTAFAGGSFDPIKRIADTQPCTPIIGTATAVAIASRVADLSTNAQEAFEANVREAIAKCEVSK